MSFSEHTSRSEEISVLFIFSELQELRHLAEDSMLEHEIMMIAKWTGEFFILEACVFQIDSENSDIREETESDLNISFVEVDEENLGYILTSVIDMMPSIDEISEDTGFDIRKHSCNLFQQMVEQVKNSRGLLRLGMDVIFNKESIRLNRWTSFVGEGCDTETLSVIEEHGLQHNFNRPNSDSLLEG